MKNKILQVNQILVKKFGIPRRNKKLPKPIDMIVATILSQNTNDKNSYKAFQRLKKDFPTWQKAAEAKRTKIENSIRIAGLGKQKSSAIKNLLNGLLAKQGKISLDHLKDETDEDALNELTNYKGVGIKTASCVLLFSLDRNVCPVDTHVHRTLNRIGLANTKTPEKTFIEINRKLPGGIAHQFHTNLIRLGREICKPSKPSCSICPLIQVCSYKDKNLSEDIIYKENSFMLLDNVS
jgi:endonuclease III